MTVGIENPLIFLGAGIMLNLYPGPDSLYVIGRSLAQGRGAGICGALGISSGAVIHTLLGAFGLSAVLATSASAFTILKYVGGAWLIYQGLLLIFRRGSPVGLEAMHRSRENLWRIYRQGVLTNVLNPKVALFFLAFLPQFISTTSPSKVLPFIILGLIFITTGTIWCVILALFASAMAVRLQGRGNYSEWLRRLSGGLFILLGLRLAFPWIDP